VALTFFEPEQLRMNRNRFFLLFSAAVTFGVFYYLFQFISLRDVIDLIRGIDRTALVMFFILSLSMSFFRCWRYTILLRVSGYRPNSVILFLIVIVRNFFSDIVPARIGTAIYIYLVNSRLKVPLPVATSSFALAFLFDMIALAPLVIFAVFSFGVPETIPVWPLAIASIVFLIICLGILRFLPFFCDLGSFVFESLGFLKDSTRQTLSGLCNSVRAEVVRTKEAGVYGQVLLLSFMVRLGKYAALYVLLFALLGPLGFTWSDLPIGPIFLGICAAEFSASLPISGIAGFGLYEGTWHLVFVLIGFSQELASMTAISHHLFQQVYGYTFGVICLIIITLPIWKMYSVKHSEVEDSPAVFGGKFLFANVGVGLTLFMTSLFSPWQQTGKQAEGKSFSLPALEKLESLATLSETLPGEIVFDSNREGSFGIYALTTDGTRLRTIYQSEREDMYPDVSPDGEWIVFSSARSTARVAPSEVWLVNRSGEEARKIADDGVFPTFSSDGSTVYFEQQRRRVIALDLKTGEEKEIFPLANERFAGREVVKPRVSADGKFVAFTSDRPSRWHAWYADLESGEANQIAHGCEPAWSTVDSDKLVFIRTEDVLAGSGIYSYQRGGDGFQEFYDADDPFGHEYFPTLIEEDRFSLFSACPGDQHSHIEDNYQLFVRDNAADEVYRLNHDSFTNRWPKYLPAEGEAVQSE